MNLPIPARRIFTAPEKAIFHRVRQELRFWIAEHRKAGCTPATAFRVCMLLKALNRLKGRVDSHVIKVCKRGYHEPELQAAVDHYLAAAQLDVDQPLRCYVLVNTTHSKAPRPAQLHVQAAHALCELMKGYGQHPDVTRWADTDLTLVVCQMNVYHPPRLQLPGFYAGQWPSRSFVDSHYGLPLAFALYPMTERQATAMGLGALQLL